MSCRRYLLAALSIVLLTALPAAAGAVFYGWDDGNTGGWLPATGQATLESPTEGGLVGGYLLSYEDPFFYGIVGAVSYQSECTGNYADHGYVRLQLAVKLIQGSFVSCSVHARYQDASHNGWALVLPVDLGSTDWQLLHVNFDPEWSNQEALNAGWVPETASPTFAETMADVYSLAIKATGTGVCHMGIDHVALQDAASPTADTTLSGVKALFR